MTKAELSIVCVAILIAVLMAGETIMSVTHTPYPSDYDAIRDGLMAAFFTLLGVNTVQKSGSGTGTA